MGLPEIQPNAVAPLLLHLFVRWSLAAGTSPCTYEAEPSWPAWTGLCDAVSTRVFFWRLRCNQTAACVLLIAAPCAVLPFRGCLDFDPKN